MSGDIAREELSRLFEKSSKRRDLLERRKVSLKRSSQLEKDLLVLLQAKEKKHLEREHEVRTARMEASFPSVPPQLELVDSSNVSFRDPDPSVSDPLKVLLPRERYEKRTCCKCKRELVIEVNIEEAEPSEKQKAAYECTRCASKVKTRWRKSLRHLVVSHG